MRPSRRDGPPAGAFSTRQSAQPPPPGNLPAEINRFVGRGDELGAVLRMLAGSRLVTVTGMGGVGKSRLARRAGALLQEAAADASLPEETPLPAETPLLRPQTALQNRFCDGVWLIELAALQDPQLLDHAVAEALGLADNSNRPPRTALCDHLADRDLLLVVDGYEHLVAECAELLVTLLRRAPRVSVLAAGRRPLGVAGEQNCPLAPLSTAQAARLFTDRARGVVPGFRFDRHNRNTVEELCHRLDGIPLALELAAGRLRALSVDQVLYRLDDRFRLLTGTDRAAPARHQTLRTAIGWSHELCTPRERLLWARLSAFAGQFDFEAAEYVCSGPDLPADELLDVLTELVAQSVVVREEGPAGVRYRMLDTVRAYGADWLAALGDAERLRRRHRDWYVGLATWCELDWFGPRQAEVAARIDAELPNLRLALENSLAHPDEVYLGQYLAGTLWFFWICCGRLSEGRRWLERALEPGGDHDDARLKALWVCGQVAMLQGDTVTAMRRLHRCGEEARHAGNTVAATYALSRTGCLALLCDDVPRAESLLREALAAYGDIGELNSHVLMTRLSLAGALAQQGDLAGAVRAFEDVRDVCDEYGERSTRAYAQLGLAYAAFGDGDPGTARDLLTESLAVFHGFRDLLGAVLTLEMLALVGLRDDPEEAAVLQGAAQKTDAAARRASLGGGGRATGGWIWPSVGRTMFGSRECDQPRQICEAGARAALGDERYEECVRRGGRLSLSDVVGRVLGGGEVPGPRRTVRVAPLETGEPAVSPSGNGETAG